MRPKIKRYLSMVRTSFARVGDGVPMVVDMVRVGRMLLSFAGVLRLSSQSRKCMFHRMTPVGIDT